MRNFFGTKNNNQIILNGEEAKHLAVLRLQENEEVCAFCGDEFCYVCSIESISKNNAVLNIEKQELCKANQKNNITLFMGLPKGEKLELIVQKITELGVSRLVCFESEFTIAKNNPSKMQRLNKISVEACKQCGRSIPLVIEDVIKIKQIEKYKDKFDIILFANETNKTAKVNFEGKRNIAIIVGSEGGFSEKEIEFLQKITSQIGLGERILRCETAAITLCGLVSYLTEN